jgi:hypothetical protein
MLKLIQRSIAFLLLAGFIFQGCTPSKTITLAFNPKEGTKYGYVITTDLAMNQEAMGQKMKTTDHTEIYATYTITRINGDNTELTVTYDRIKMSQVAMGREFTFDTDAPDTAKNSIETSQNKIFQSLKNQPFTVVIAKDGSVKEVKGFSEIIEKEINQIPGDEKTRQIMKNALDDDFVKTAFTEFFKIYPDKPVRVNSTWNTEMQLKTIFKLLLNNTYKLTSFDDKKANLDVQSNITTNGDMEMMGMKIDASLKGNSTGTIELERSTGMVLNSNLKLTINGKMKTEGMEIPMSIEQTAKMQGKLL